MELYCSLGDAGCGCVYDASSYVAGSLLLDGPDCEGKVGGWLSALGNLIAPATGVGLLGRRSWVTVQPTLDDVDGYALSGESCDSTTGCCFTVHFDLWGLTPPFGAHVYIGSAGCSDPTMSCGDEMWGSVSVPPMTPSTTTTTTLPPVVKAQFNAPAAVAFDAAGSIYVMDGDRVQKFDAAGEFVTEWGSYGSGDGQFAGASLAVDAGGNVYVADLYNARIQKFDGNGAFLLAWGSGQFITPLGVAVDRDGSVYVSDQHRISKFDANGTLLTMWGNYGAGNGQFKYPAGVATDENGNVYVTDQYTNSVQKFDSNGTFLTRWGRSGSGDGQFLSPYGVGTDSSGNVYVSDTAITSIPASARVQKFDANGNFLATLGRGHLTCAGAVAIDRSGNVYVPDGCNHRIVELDPTGAVLLTWGRVCASCR